MNVHSRARTAPFSRALLVSRVRAGWSVDQAAAAAGVAPLLLRRYRSLTSPNSETDQQS